MAMKPAEFDQRADALRADLDRLRAEAERLQREHMTLVCVGGDHDGCLGYVAPLVYAATRPCQCGCHEAGGRDWGAALARARASYYYGPRP